MNLRLGQRIFQGIVQQNGDQLADVLFTARQGEHGLNGKLYGSVLLPGQGQEGLGRFLHHIGQGKFHKLHRWLFLIHP